MASRDVFFIRLVSKNAAIGDLQEESTNILSAAWTIFCYARYPANKKAEKHLQYVTALVIGELMAQKLPDSCCLEADKATEEFDKVMVYLSQNETIHTRQLGIKVWIEEIKATNLQLDEHQRRIAPDTNKLDHNDYTVYLSWLAYKLNNKQYLKTLEVSITICVGIAKRGLVFQELIDKIVASVKDDLGEDITLDALVMYKMYANYGVYIHAFNVNNIFAQWLNYIPSDALRVRRFLNKLNPTGMTSFITVGKAIKKFPDFDWIKLNVLTSNELTNFQKAVAVVGGNKFYGFNHDLGYAQSIFFKSTAYVAKELLIKISREANLRNYAGWIKRSKVPFIILDMIENYVSEYKARNMGIVPEDRIAEGLQPLLNMLNEPHNIALFNQ